MFSAYYCFINFGVLPHEYAELPFTERALIAAFIDKEIESREKKAR